MSDKKVLEFKPKQKYQKEQETLSSRDLFYEYMDEIGVTEVEDIVEIMTHFSLQMILIFDMGCAQFIHEMGGLFKASTTEFSQNEDTKDNLTDASINQHALQGLAAILGFGLFKGEDADGNISSIMNWLSDARGAYEYFGGKKPDIYDFIIYELREMGEIE